MAQKTLNISLDFRVISAILLVVIVGMLAVWRPWQATAGDRTIKVTGQATVTAVPDEFVFYPSYQHKTLDELTKKSDAVVAKLKELGVADSKIKTNSSGYDMPVYIKDGSTAPTYTLSLTVTVDNKELAQKVQDYLVTSSPMGSVSPQATFSDTKRLELETNARDQATKDARAKAEQSAKNLGFGLGAVKTVEDGAGFDGLAYASRGGVGVAEDSKLQLTVQPGENELNYTVTVTYILN
jgi:uncharacterized protein